MTLCLCMRVGHCFVHWSSSLIVRISSLDHMPSMVGFKPFCSMASHFKIEVALFYDN